MKKRMLTFRCPDSLMPRVDELMESSGISFSHLMLQAMDLYVRHIQSQGGRLMPEYSPDDLRSCGKYYSLLLDYQRGRKVSPESRELRSLESPSLPDLPPELPNLPPALSDLPEGG